MKPPSVQVGIGQDSHRFLPADSSKLCIIAGVIFQDVPGFSADSDGDVVFHAICNAITSVTHVPILGKVAIELCHKDGITDSQVYLERALETLHGKKVAHVAISLEGKRPKFQPKVDAMRAKIASVMGLDITQVGITATSGDGLTDFGCGDGVQAFALVTVISGQ